MLDRQHFDCSTFPYCSPYKFLLSLYKLVLIILLKYTLDLKRQRQFRVGATAYACYACAICHICHDGLSSKNASAND